MKKGWKVFLVFVGIVLLALVIILSMMGYLPFFGANKPRNLGIKYTDADFASARAKSQIEYAALLANTPDSESLQRTGTRAVAISLSSAEMSSLLNDRPWKYWPIKQVQLRINNDGTAELSGVLIKDRLRGYAAGIGAPAQVAETVATFLPPNSTFYVKAKTSLAENKVGDFDIQSVYLGKMPIPVGTLLSDLGTDLIKSAYAANAVSELSKYSDKKAAIIGFINDRLAQITGFNAKSAYFKDGQLFFDGNLSEKELTTR